ncbi:MAG TPA: hypothetical protein VLN44_01870, partial [Pyrinomonadaceae bacterium]|nr:hypothetical protein [Pyrinomonadaceae bacterium]
AEEVLWRRLTTPDWIKVTNGTSRVSSAAFKGHDKDLELSTHIARLTTLDWVFGTPPDSLGVAEILAQYPQELGLRVEHDPEPNDYSHAVIHLSPVYGNRKKHAKKMASHALLRPKPLAKLAAGDAD